MSNSETDLPPRPDQQTGDPWPPAPPGVLGLERHTAKTTASAGDPPAGRGPALAVQGDSWWSAPLAAVVLSVVTGVIFSFQGDDWATDPIAWGLVTVVFVVTLVREWGIKLVAGADWLRVNGKWVDTYELTHIELRGAWFGWMLRLKDASGRRVRTYMTDLEANQRLWALVYNGMLHSAFHGAEVNNVAAGMLHLRPGFEALRYQVQRPKIPTRTVWTLLLVAAAVLAAIYLFRPDLLGPALAILAVVAVVVAIVVVLLAAVFRRRVNDQE